MPDYALLLRRVQEQEARRAITRNPAEAARARAELERRRREKKEKKRARKEEKKAAKKPPAKETFSWIYDRPVDIN